MGIKKYPILKNAFEAERNNEFQDRCLGIELAWDMGIKLSPFATVRVTNYYYFDYQNRIKYYRVRPKNSPTKLTNSEIHLCYLLINEDIKTSQRLKKEKNGKTI